MRATSRNQRKEASTHGRVSRLSGRWVLAAVALLIVFADRAPAQSSSLFGNPARRRPLKLADHSWIYQAPNEPVPMRINDILTIIVDEKSQVISEGEVDRKKKAKLEAILKDWVLLKNWTMYPDPQSDGDPKVFGQWDNKYKAEAELETRDAMKFRIACRWSTSDPTAIWSSRAGAPSATTTRSGSSRSPALYAPAT